MPNRPAKTAARRINRAAAGPVGARYPVRSTRSVSHPTAGAIPERTPDPAVPAVTPAMVSAPGPEPGPALERALPESGRAWELALELLRLQEPGGITTPCVAVHEGLGDPGPCGRRHVAGRSSLVRWLDGLDVEKLDPRVMPPLWSGASFAEKEVAFRWWNVAYYDAICERDDLRMLTLHNVTESETAGAADADLEVAWGLRRPLPSRAERIRSRLSPQGVGPSGDLGIEGEVVRHLPLVPSLQDRLRVGEVAVKRSPCDPGLTRDTRHCHASEPMLGHEGPGGVHDGALHGVSVRVDGVVPEPWHQLTVAC